MTRRLLVLAFALALGAPAASAAPVCSDQLAGINERCPEWVASYSHTGRGGRGEDVLRAAALSPDGATLYVTGQSRDDATLDDQAVVALDAATGARRWVARFDAAGRFDTGSAITVSADGKVVVAAGRSTGDDGSFDWITVAYDAATGQRLWDARHATPESDRTWGVAAAPDGGEVYVVGEVGGGDIGAVAYDAASGDVIWESAYDNGGYDWALDIGISSDGDTLYAGGTSGSGVTAVDLVAVAFRTAPEGDTPAGSVRWVGRIDGGDRLNETFGGLAVGAEGVALAGWTTRSGGTKTLTALLDAETGEPAWTAQGEGIAGDSDQREAVAIGGGRVFRVDWVAPDSAASGEYATTAYDAADGGVLWSSLQGSEPITKDSAKAVAVSPDGRRVFVSGYSVLPYGQTGNLRIEPGHITTVSYDAQTGARRWVAQHNESGVGADFAVSVIPSHDGGRVYVGGTFITSGVHVWPTDLAMAYAYDFGVLAYDA